MRKTTRTARVAARAVSVPARDAQQDQQGTRNKVARSLLHHGPSTAAELAARLGLTQAAVRRHLDAMLADGMVAVRQQRVRGTRGRGRPARAFALTDYGRDAFDQAYDELAADALRWIAQSAGGGASGDAAVTAFARARLAAQAERYRAAVEQAALEDRTRALAEALTRDGYAATAREAPAVAAGGVLGRGFSGGEQLCQHHCPVAHTAEQFPQLCEAETEVFAELLGTHVQRLATIAHGDGVCTTFVPRIRGGSGRDGARGGRGTRKATTGATTPGTTTGPASTAGRNPE